MTTLSLIISIIAKYFLHYGNTKLYEGVIKYCSFKDDDGEEQLRISNEDFPIYSIIVYDFCLKDGEEFDIERYLGEKKKKITSSEKVFVDCYKYFQLEIEKRLEKLELAQKIVWLNSFRDAVINLKIIQITSDKEQEGYIIFETLNARGLPLEQHELIKNYIFMYNRDSVGSDLPKEKWDLIIKNVDSIKNSNLSAFISHYISHAFGKVSKKEEYSIVRANIKKHEVSDFLDDLLYKSELYYSFCEVGESKSPCVKYVFNFLNNIRNKQFRPILLSLF